MADRKIPEELKIASSDKDVKRSFFSDITSNNPYDCENCGGVGRMFVFIALEGPYNSPGPITKVSHWSDDKWWVGNTIGATCPECRGEGKKGSHEKAEKLYPVEDKVREVVDTMKGAR